MTGFMRLILSLSLSGSALVLVVFGLTKLLGGRLGKAWQYYIWLPVVLRFLLPVAVGANPVGALLSGNPPWQAAIHEEAIAPQSPYAVSPAPEAIDAPASNPSSLPAANQPAAGTVLPANIPMDDPMTAPGPGPAAEKTMAASPPGQGDALTLQWIALAQWLWIPWAGVALLLLARKITLYRRFAVHIRAGSRPVTGPAAINALARARGELGIRRHIGLQENAYAPSPLIIGVIRPSIVLPSLNHADADFRAILLHELTHFKRRDILYKWLVQATLCLHWFNPLVPLMARRINQSCELACDEAVIRRLDAEGRKAYGNVLIESIRRPQAARQGPTALTLSESAKTVKERLQEIMKYRKPTRRMTAVSLALALLIAMGGLLLGAAVPGYALQAGAAQEPDEPTRLWKAAYSFLSGMAEIDTDQSIRAYRKALERYVKEAPTDYIEVYFEDDMSLTRSALDDYFYGVNEVAGSELINPEDPIFDFVTKSYARTSAELLLESLPYRLPGFYGSAAWAREQPSPAWLAVEYRVTYEIKDYDSLTVAGRDAVFDGIAGGMQAWLDGLDEQTARADDLAQSAGAELSRLCGDLATKALALEGEIVAVEGNTAGGTPVMDAYATPYERYGPIGIRYDEDTDIVSLYGEVLGGYKDIFITSTQLGNVSVKDEVSGELKEQYERIVYKLDADGYACLLEDIQAYRGEAFRWEGVILSVLSYAPQSVLMETASGGASMPVTVQNLTGTEWKEGDTLRMTGYAIRLDRGRPQLIADYAAPIR